MNPWLREFLKVDAQNGAFSMYAELAAADGRFEGYIKPILEDPEIFDTKEATSGPFQKAWEAIVGLAAKVLENRQEEQVATRIPFSGNLDNPRAGVLAALVNLVRNAFVAAFAHSLEGSISLRDVGEDVECLNAEGKTDCTKDEKAAIENDAKGELAPAESLEPADRGSNDATAAGTRRLIVRLVPEAATMLTFTCDSCTATLYFENDTCLACGRKVGFRSDEPHDVHDRERGRRGAAAVPQLDRIRGLQLVRPGARGRQRLLRRVLVERGGAGSGRPAAARALGRHRAREAPPDLHAARDRLAALGARRQAAAALPAARRRARRHGRGGSAAREGADLHRPRQRQAHVERGGGGRRAARGDPQAPERAVPHDARPPAPRDRPLLLVLARRRHADPGSRFASSSATSAPTTWRR